MSVPATSQAHLAPQPVPSTGGGGRDTRPPRTARGLLLLPPWIRAPMLGLRQPGAFFAVAVAAAILACAAASAALFLSSASSASLQQQINDRCANAAYPLIGTSTYLGPGSGQGAPVFTSQTDHAYPQALARQGMQSNPVFIGAPSGLDVNGAQTTSAQNVHFVRPFFRPGAVHQLTVLDSGPGNGVYVPTFLADYAGVSVGDTLTVDGAGVPIVGVYQNLYDEPVRPFWCSYSALFSNETNANIPPADLVIATDEADFYRLAMAHDSALTQGGFGFFGEAASRSWEVPIEPSTVTRTSAIQSLERQNTALLEATSISGDSGREFNASFQGEELGRLIVRTQRLENGLRGPVIPTAVAGTILAMLLVAAAGSYWADRRLREVRLLSSRGVGPGALAVKAGLELVIPAALGTVAGYYLARGLIALAGPANDLDPDALSRAVLTTIAGFVIGLILLSTVAGIRSRNFTEKPIGHKGSWLRFVPYELILLGGAAFLWWQLRSQDAVVFDGSVAQVNGLLVSFPLLFLAGSAVLVVRLIVVLLPALRRHAQGWSPAAFVAVNQLTANRVVSASLLAALCLPIAVLTYSATLTASSQRTVQSKALVGVGAERA
ncbi:MAG: hypothetical protein H0T54_10570, partial [Geodermatophilaceae bacterium]|nr:hypothetical protein [Geodermatophilaceae bacterium]